jgi:hypothetical protein
VVLESITLSPTSGSISVGATQQFTATGNYSNGTMQNLTSSVTWTSSVPADATIGAGGLATGVAAGSTYITATAGSVASLAAELTVTAAGSTPSWTLVQHVPVTCAQTNATCTAILDFPTGSGHLITILGALYNTVSAVTISSVTSTVCSGSWFYPPGATVYNGADGSGTNGAYCLNSASGKTSITVTLSAGTGAGYQTFDFIEYAWSGSTILPDGAPASVNNTTESSTVSGVAQTLTGSDDVIVQWISCAWAIKSISGSYTTPFDAVTGGNGYAAYAGWINTSTGTPTPTWALSNFVGAQTASMAFSGK